MDYKNKILEIISSLSVIPTDEINKDDELRSLGIDSLTKTQLIITLEDELGITFGDSDLDPNNLNLVSDVGKLVEKHLN